MSDADKQNGVFPLLCRRCKWRPAVEGRRTCAHCLSVASASESKRQKRWRKEGKCSFCGATKDREGALCAKCAERTRNQASRTAARRLAAGFCRICGKEPFVQNSAGEKASDFCQRCYLRNMAGKHLGSYLKWPVLLDKLYRQGWRCIYTGERLEIGVNLSFDHLDPISRFPEKRFDPSNVEPCSIAINLMKREMTRKEFLDTCYVVVRYRAAQLTVA